MQNSPIKIKIMMQISPIVVFVVVNVGLVVPIGVFLPAKRHASKQIHVKGRYQAKEN